MWTLTVKTSLPNPCWTDEDLKVTSSVFETFEDAKRSLRATLKELAFTPNAMFDGNGYLDVFSSYINYEEDCLDGEDLEEDESFETDEISIGFLKALHEALRSVFSGETVKLPFLDQEYEDLFLKATVSNGKILLKGYGEGLWNGIDPYLDTNMFDMTEEKNYHLYIDDFFGGPWDQEASSELYIDLAEAKQ